MRALTFQAEGDVKVTLVAELYHEMLFSQRAGGRPQLSYFDDDPWVNWVYQHADRRDCRHYLDQLLQ